MSCLRPCPLDAGSPDQMLRSQIIHRTWKSMCAYLYNNNQPSGSDKHKSKAHLLACFICDGCTPVIKTLDKKHTEIWGEQTSLMSLCCSQAHFHALVRGKMAWALAILCFLTLMVPVEFFHTQTSHSTSEKICSETRLLKILCNL